MAFMKDDLSDKLREERIKRNVVPGNNLHINKGNIYLLDSEVDNVLKQLKSQEPNSDNLFFRLAIINYEFGDLNRAIVYSERFCNDETMFKIEEGKEVMFRDGFKDKKVILSEGRLAMADMLTQLYLLSLSLGWDWNELRKLGADHLAERHKDFNRDGWKDPKKKVEE